jgi:hypothetical protein
MGGKHDKAALEQLSKRRERTFKLDAELTSTNQYLGNFNINYRSGIPIRDLPCK